MDSSRPTTRAGARSRISPSSRTPVANPIPPGVTIRPAEITSSGIIASLQGGLGGGYHLGGVKVDGTSFLWKTAKTVTTTSGEPFPSDGSYDNGQSQFSPYAGSTALAADRLIV